MWVGLHKIPHRLHQQSLAIHVPGIRIALTPPRDLGRYRDGKDFGHKSFPLFPLFRAQARFSLLQKDFFCSIPSSRCFFSFNLSPRGYVRSPGYPFGDKNLVLDVVFNLKTLSEIFSLSRMSE